jgi:hypothetical protein
MSNAKIAYYDDQDRVIFRASAVNKCSRALIASLQGYDAMEPGPDMQARFSDGHRLEPVLLSHLESQGWHLYGGQEEYELELGKDIIIRGHVDSLASHPEHGIALVECKTMAPASYEDWKKKKWQGSDLFRHYADQCSVYWEAVKPQLLVMVCGRKANDGIGETYLDDIDVSFHFEPPASLNRIKARLAKVMLAAKQPLPETCDKSDYPCPFYYMHEDTPTQYETWSHEEQLDEMAQAMELYLQHAALERAAKKDKDEARKDIDRLLNGQTAAQSNRFVVEYLQNNRTFIDEAKLLAAGIDVEQYKTTVPGVKIQVKELKA